MTNANGRVPMICSKRLRCAKTMTWTVVACRASCCYEAQKSKLVAREMVYVRSYLAGSQFSWPPFYPSVEWPVRSRVVE